MTYVWRAEIRVWPQFTGRGRDVDQKEAGERIRVVEVRADSIDEALKSVKLYRDGIVTNPMVWQSPIFKLERISP